MKKWIGMAAALMMFSACQESNLVEEVAPQNSLATQRMAAPNNGLMDNEVKASIDGVANAITGFNNQIKGGKGQDTSVDALMAHVEKNIGDEDFNVDYQTDEEAERPDEFKEEQDFSQRDLSPEAQQILNRYMAEVDELGAIAEANKMPDAEVLANIQELNHRKMEEVSRNGKLEREEREALYSTFYANTKFANPMYNYFSLTERTLNEARFWRRLGRAIARVAVAVAVTAVVIAVPVAAVVVAKAAITGVGLAAVKVAGVKGAGKIIGSAVFKGLKLGKKSKIKMAGSWFGAKAGLKNAAKNWSKPWQGAPEFTFGVKLKW